MIYALFTDPVFRGPVLGCMLMSFASSLIGTLSFLQKRSLIGEALSHSAYPGVVFGALAITSSSFYSETTFLFALLIGGFITSLLGAYSISFLETKLRIKSDSALCLVLSLFFGLGLLGASYLQSQKTVLYREIQLYLFGQAATMQDYHIAAYGILALLITLFVTLFFRNLKTISFDPLFAKTLGIKVFFLETLSFLLLTLAIVLGIRSVGVVLMAGMLIIPTATAKNFCKSFATLLSASAFFALLSSLFGIYLSIVLSSSLFFLPTGPTIIVTATLFFLISFLGAPQKGVIPRGYRALKFRLTCQLENHLKSLWKASEESEALPSLSWWARIYMKKKGWIASTQQGIRLTSSGKKRGSRIVRLHRLWEVYLVNYLGQQAEKVHRNAEQLEHLFTPQLEKTLSSLLENPSYDPHQQPIPPLVLKKTIKKEAL